MFALLWPFAAFGDVEGSTGGVAHVGASALKTSGTLAALGIVPMPVVSSLAATGRSFIARPIGDAADGGWTTQDNASTNLWAVVSEGPASDGDYVQSPHNASGATVRFTLESAIPATGVSVIRLRAHLI